MNILKILESEELQDIPILYILRIIHVIQKEKINAESSNICEKLSKNNERVKE